MASTNLSPSAQRVQDELSRRGLTCQVVEHAEPTRTAAEAAERAGCSIAQIVKSLIFRGAESGKPILVLTSGANRVDERRIAQHAGEPIVRAGPDFVRSVTGFAIGGVPPVAHVSPMETYIDEDLLAFDTIWAAAGTPNAIFRLTPAELRELTAGRVIAV